MKPVTAQTLNVPFPFIRPELRSKVMMATSLQDIKDFEATIGVSFNGYGFGEGEFLYIPNLPNFDKDPSKSKTILKVPVSENSTRDTLLVHVYRYKPTSDGTYRKIDSWLNTSRLTERSFVDQEFPDEFRKRMYTEFTNDPQRIEYLSGHLIQTVGSTMLKSYKFVDGQPEVDAEGEKVVIDQPHRTVEDLGPVSLEELPFKVAE